MEFCDDAFPPETASLGSNEWNAVWLRPAEFLAAPAVLAAQTSGGDLRPGRLVNPGFLAALAAVADERDCLAALFATADATSRVTVLLHPHGVPTPIDVDSRIPCSKKRRVPLFASSGDALWAPLLEKAYAKCCGSYFATETVLPFEALFDLTGSPQRRFAVAQHADKLHAKLLRARKRHDVVLATVGPADDAAVGASGLAPHRAYTVLRAAELAGEQAVLLRGVWGADWTGRWAPNDAAWTSELLEEFQPHETGPGLFWMPYADFCRVFVDVTIARALPQATNGCVALTLATKQTRVPIATPTEQQAFVTAIQRDATPLALRMWIIDTAGAACGGDTGETFVRCSLLSGKVVRLEKPGEYSLVVEVPDTELEHLPHTLSIAFRSASPLMFPQEPHPVSASDHILYTSPVLEKNAPVCPRCNKPIPSGPTATTSVGVFHLPCFTCGVCGASLGENIALRGSLVICRNCAQIDPLD